ncbi:MAG: hypothetical protein QOG26_1289 [Solirubrobacterales bacterium]|nr:hypothetical protein [Solirubrobacterales bacterium]
MVALAKIQRLTWSRRGACVALALLAVGLPTTASARTHVGPLTTAHYRSIVATLDQAHPGRGREFNHSTRLDEPMTYGGVISAEARRYHATGSTDALDRMRVCGQWLLDNSDINANGVVGYGLPVAFDAFGDGSVNPPNHEYTVTSAAAMEGLLDWLATDPAAPASAIQATIEGILAPYRGGDGFTPRGLFAYDFFDPDEQADVYNVAALMAAQVQRYSSLVADPERTELRGLADASIDGLVDARRTDSRGNHYWRYSSRASRPNDFDHATATAVAIEDYRRYGGSLGSGFDLARVRGSLGRFEVRGRWWHMPSMGRWRDLSRNLPAHLGALGYGLRAISWSSRRDRAWARSMAEQVKRYRLGWGSYAGAPGKPRFAFGDMGILMGLAEALYGPLT